MAATAQVEFESGLATSRSNPTLARIIAGRGVHAVYQPIVELATGQVVGYEALARGPRGSAYERPDLLFAEARRVGLLAELEWACQRAALQGALDGGLDASQALFVNVEPSLISSAAPDSLRALFAQALQQLTVFVELTERSLTAEPTVLLGAVDRMRARGISVALDDVGVDPRSLALMPFLAPEMIKLDLRLVQCNPSRQIAAIVHAVNAESERTGALLLAEGIETEDHLRQALALGARYGQGWYFGRPGALSPSRGDRRPFAVESRDATITGTTPFGLVAGHRPTRQGDKRLLLALSRQIEEAAASQGPTAVLLSTFQEARYFTHRTAERYARLAQAAALVGALGVGMSAVPASRVRGASLDESEALRGEWNVIALGPHFAAAFVARDLGTGGRDLDRRFDFALTYERELVIRAAREMMRRVASVQT